MNKKAQVISFYDIASWLILIIGMTIWIIIMRYEGISHKTVVEDKVNRLGNDEVFLTILRTELNDTEISDLLIQSYEQNNINYFEDEFSYLLKDYYGSDVCWKLLIDEKTAFDRSCISAGKDNLLDSTIYLPGESDAIKLQLVIKGYK
ncbi:MAG: hypothetical protein ABIJ34_00590 [archaeon]